MDHGQTKPLPEIPGEARLSATLAANDDDPAHLPQGSIKSGSAKEDGF
jgi:hypothetical protein